MSSGICLPKVTLVDVFHLSLEDYLRHGESRKIQLERINLIVKIALDSLDLFRQGKWTLYDALACDSGCHLRAWMLYELACKYRNDPLFSIQIARGIQSLKEINHYLETLIQSQERFFQVQEKMNVITKKIHAHRLPAETFNVVEIKEILNGIDSVLSLTTYKALHKLMSQLNITLGMELLMHAYVLTVSRDWNKNGIDQFGYPKKQKLNHQLLKTKYNCSKWSAESIIRISQRSLSDISLNYIRHIARQVAGASLEDRLSDPFIGRNHKKVASASCYYEFYALLLYAKRISMPFLFVLKYQDESGIVYKVSWLFKSSYFIPDHPTDEELRKPVVVLDSLGHWSKEGQSPEEKALRAIQKHGLEKLILAFAAQHEQYPKGVSGMSTLPFDPDLETHRRFAEAEGFSYKNFTEKEFLYKNPSVFLIKHAFCDQLSNHQSSLSKRTIFQK